MRGSVAGDRPGRRADDRACSAGCSPSPRPIPSSRPTPISCQLQDQLRQHRGRAAGLAALLQRHRPRPEHLDPELPGSAVRAARWGSAKSPSTRTTTRHPERAEGRVRPPSGVSPCAVVAALCACWPLVRPPAASAEERIPRFISDVQVQPDGSLDVTETIDVRAEGNAHQPRHLPRFPDPLSRPQRRTGPGRLRARET